jgi:hypothetical protein
VDQRTPARCRTPSPASPMANAPVVKVMKYLVVLTLVVALCGCSIKLTGEGSVLERLNKAPVPPAAEVAK